METIEVKNLSKEFRLYSRKDALFRQFGHLVTGSLLKNTILALSDISFSVMKGERLGIIGPNGSGKTTLLKVIAGIIKPTQGYISRNGEINCFFRWGVGFLPDLTVRENLYLYGAFLGLDRIEISEKLNAIIDFSQFRKPLDIKLSSCSIGTMEKLAFGIAMQAKSDILLFDELLEVGDVNFEDNFFDLFNNANKNGMTIILASHNLDIVERLCERTIYLKEGRQVMITDTKEAVSQYKKGQC